MCLLVDKMMKNDKKPTVTTRLIEYYLKRSDVHLKQRETVKDKAWWRHARGLFAHFGGKKVAGKKEGEEDEEKERKGEE